MSTVAEDSGNSLVYTLIIFVFLSSLLPVFVWSSTTDLIVGPAPEYPEGLVDFNYGISGTAVTAMSITTEESDTSEGVTDITEDEAWQKYMEEMEEYWGKREMISGFVNLLSPTNNFQDIMNTLTYSSNGLDNLLRSSYSPMDEESTGVMDVLGKLLWNFVALIAIPAVFFGAAYIRFMRLDVR